jgi:hypothetical protein
MGTGAAVAAQVQHQNNNNHFTCTGTLAKPGVLAGTYHGNVVVTGVCVVNGGAAVVEGDLILAPGSALNATFALNDVAKKGTSSLVVRDDIKVGPSAVLAMGCQPNFSPCSDDPNAAKGGTLTGQNFVFGDVRAWHALSVILAASTIFGNVNVHGGGGGVTCAVPPTGIFHALKSPVFSDAENNFIGADLTFTGLRTCWLGALRNSVRGNLFSTHNTMADSDANEILANVIRGSIACSGNTPAVQYGDSGSSPNLVHDNAFGECSFSVLKPNPAPNGPLSPISVKI